MITVIEFPESSIIACKLAKIGILEYECRMVKTVLVWQWN